MTPTKFESNIKNKLETRKINPTTESWNKLQEKLDTQLPNRNRKLLLWRSIAASFIGVLLLSVILFNKGVVPTTPTNTLSNTPKKKIETQQVLPTKIISKKQHQIPIKKSILLNPNKSLVSNPVQPKQHKKVSVANGTNAVTNNIDKEIFATQINIESQQVNRVVAEIKRLTKHNNTLAIDSEVDALLQQAQLEIAFNKLYQEAIQTVNANDLLLEIETSLEKSFRDKVFKKIIAGIKDFKVVLHKDIIKSKNEQL